MTFKPRDLVNPPVGRIDGVIYFGVFTMPDGPVWWKVTGGVLQYWDGAAWVDVVLPYSSTVERGVNQLDGAGQFTVTLLNGGAILVASWWSTPGAGILNVTQMSGTDFLVQSSLGAADAGSTFGWIAD